MPSTIPLIRKEAKAAEEQDAEQDAENYDVDGDDDDVAHVRTKHDDDMTI